MGKGTKVVITIVLTVVFLLILSAIGNSGAKTGSILAYLGILLIVGYIAALIAIWKKKKTEE